MARRYFPAITTAQRITETFNEREMVYDTDLDRAYIGDGATTGGLRLALYSEVATFSGTSTDNAIARFDGVSGKIQDSGLVISDANYLSGLARIDIVPSAIAFDLFANVAGAGINFGSTSVTIAANKELCLLRADNTMTIGAGGNGHFININLTADASSDATANLGGIVSNIINNGPATVDSFYAHVTGFSSSVGNIIAIKTLTTPGASTATAYNIQIAFDSTLRKVDQGIHFNSNGGSNGADYGILAGTDVKINSAFIQAAAVGAGSFLVFKNSTASANLFSVDATGAVVSAAAISGTVLTGSTSLIAASNSNGITITAGNITRNAAAGSMVIEAGTNTGNQIALKTNNATKMAILDASVTFTNVITPSANDGAALGNTSLMWSDAFLASGAVINFNAGDVTITHSLNNLAFAGGTYSFDDFLLCATGKGIKVNAVQVVSDRVTGFTTSSGTANKNASGINVDTITATDANLRAVGAWLKALNDAVATHGLIGA